MAVHAIDIAAAFIFALALLHTFSTQYFRVLAKRYPKHAGFFHLLSEVEVVFGFWAFICIAFLILFSDTANAIHYVESRQYTEPLFVFVIMVVAASKPVLDAVRVLIAFLARAIPFNNLLVKIWLSLAIVPILGSFITEPAAMTLAALMLAPLVFNQQIPEQLKYATLGVLFVNISIGGTLTAYAAPPVLMVANSWQWDSLFMASTFGWRAIIATFINTSVLCYFLRRHLVGTAVESIDKEHPAPMIISGIHLLFLFGVVVFAHHPIIFSGLFLLFLGFTQAYQRYQSPLLLKEGLLVGVFLAGLVILGGMQQWWLQPIVSQLAPLQLFFGAITLTAITDNAALTYLGSLIHGMSDEAKYMLMAGAVSGGGLTIIANAPNPAGIALLKQGFNGGAVSAWRLLTAAIAPTLIAAAMFLI